MTDRFKRLTAAAMLSGAVLLLATAATAQTKPATILGGGQNAKLGTPELEKRIKGKEVWITTTDGVRRKGIVFEVTPTGLTFSALPSTPLRNAEIVKIQLASHTLRNSILIGVAVGGGVQFVSDLVSYWPDESCLAETFICAAGGPLGLGIGTLIGLVSRLDDVIYDASRRRTSIGVVPIVSAARKGVSLSIRWR